MSIRKRFKQMVGWMGQTSPRSLALLSPGNGVSTYDSRVESTNCCQSRRSRSISVEQLEPRQLMAADVRVGAVYIEKDSGSDSEPDKFYVSFLGGAPNTQLRRLVFNGDLYQPGLSHGDMIFDTAPGGLGSDESHPFKVESLETKHSAATVKATVVDGSSQLVLEFSNFFAGDKLIFSIDVDEVAHMKDGETDISKINEGIDPIASGVEFQGTRFTADFVAPHYESTSGTAEFVNIYDPIVDPLGLGLPRDNDNGRRDRTTGVGLTVKQTPKPISLAGTVWVDANEDLKIGSGETRLVNVAVELYRLEGSQYVSTGQRTLTDSLGRYSFGTSLGLKPGTYQVRQTQPDGYYSVGATAGKLTSGQSVGQLVSGNTDMITQIDLNLGDSHAVDLNFAENLPSRLSGHVCYVTTGMDCFSANSTKAPQANVLIELLDNSGRVVASTRTATDGTYAFTGLRAGTYGVRQTNASGRIDGAAKAGSNGGSAVDPNNITQIILGGGVTAVDYDFCDLVPAEISGHTYFDANNNGRRDPGEDPLANVKIEILNATGVVIASTTTNTQGFYSFTGLKPGVYTIVEETPSGYLPGQASAGSLGGQTDRTGDVIKAISLGSAAKGINYDFGELLVGSLAGSVYVDSNGDCLRQAHERPLAGVTITLLNEAGSVVTSTVTDAAGRYQFGNLAPGKYTVRQTQPAGYLQGGQKAGSGGGNDSVQDVISAIDIGPGEDLVDYDFCEQEPGSLSGTVFLDSNGDCIHDENERGLAGVRIELLDASGRVVGQTLTDQQGDYHFDNLTPGTYSVREYQPAGYLQGGQKAGSRGGNVSVQDLISEIQIGIGEDLIDYDFCEQEPGSISGTVFVDADGDCFQSAQERGLAGVRVELLDTSGRVVAQTLTDGQGNYTFGNLTPGTYSVRESQPSGYFQGGQVAPATGGDDSIQDLISLITVGSGQHITDANFCEIEPAKLSGYVFQDGAEVITERGEIPENIGELRDGIRTADDTPIAGVRIQLYDGTGKPMRSSDTLPGAGYSGQFVEAVTNSLGYYEFIGLPPGIYYVFEVHPIDYFDYIDTPGTTGGFALNSQAEVDGLRNDTTVDLVDIADLTDAQLMDGIWAIELMPGVHSQENNFSELKTRDLIFFPPPPDRPKDFPKVEVGRENFPAPQPLGFSPLVWSPLPIILGVGAAADVTWHLSIINGGTPRGARNGEELTPETIADNADHLNFRTWTVRGMRASNYRYISLSSQASAKLNSVFYIPGAKPLMGDFNGDGLDELALFLDGEWFIDVNGNGRWDEADIWLKLGTKGDQPVVGDWDGDGKDDVGVFGKRWAGDDRALAAEPGMPDPAHFVKTKRPKNVPRPADEVPETPRLMQPSREGRARADVIDHVFRLGSSRDIAIAGHFNEDGVATIGTFRDGLWKIDTNGDGKPDKTIEFGQKGDLPLVGDFINQDGVDEIAIVRGNKVIVDSNHNGQIDVTDQVFLLESTEGHVIVGDFDGDGNDEPALYQSPDQQRSLQARRNAG